MASQFRLFATVLPICTRQDQLHVCQQLSPLTLFISTGPDVPLKLIFCGQVSAVLWSTVLK